MKNTGACSRNLRALDVLRCATEGQAGDEGLRATIPAHDRIEFRIGIHQGDVVIEDNDIFRDALDGAARLESLTEPGRRL